jgi:ABC-2 type transport system permease protein
MTGSSFPRTDGPAPPASGGLVGPVLALLEREVVHFVRQRSRLLSVLTQPLLFWLLLGAGFGASFTPAGAPAGTGYLTWFFPGMIVMILLFTAIFSTISIIEDRKAGFLQGVLVAPAPRLALVLGSVLGGTILAVGQGTLILLAAPLVATPLTPGAVALSVVVLSGIALALTGVGFCMAWRMESTQGFHMVMNLFLLPMWLLSGALFPLEGTPVWLRLLMEVNPLTYGVAALRHTLGQGQDASLPSLGLSLAVTAFFALLPLVTAVLLVRTAPETGS